MKRLIALATVIAGTLACAEENACDRYADYICTCHAEDTDEDFDCEALRDLAIDPTAPVVDACTIDLQEQKAKDDDAGLTCSTTA